jgi:hypothetical protein
MAATQTKRGPGRPRKDAAPIIEQEEATVIPLEPMEEEDTQDVQGESVPDISTHDLAAAVHALAKGQETLINSQVRKVPFANHKPRSSFNPTGKKRRKLTRRCYQNGYPMNINLLHDEEIELLNRLQAGKYLNGLVTVRVEDKGAESALNIIYRNKSVDERFALKNEFRDLREFLRRADKEGPMES